MIMYDLSCSNEGCISQITGHVITHIATHVSERRVGQHVDVVALVYAGALAVDAGRQLTDGRLVQRALSLGMAFGVGFGLQLHNLWHVEGFGCEKEQQKDGQDRPRLEHGRERDSYCSEPPPPRK